jgi:hypothetical protein
MKVEVLFYKADKGAWDDKLIACWTRGKYSHTELKIGNICYTSYPNKGVVRRNLNVTERLYEIIELEIAENDINKIIDFYNQTQGNKYDWFGILGFIFPLQDRSDRWFCSEWVTKALQLAGVEKLWLLEPSKTSPNKLYKTLIKE